jgi:hypothetical protein
MRRLAVLLAALLIGCSSERDPGPVFDNEGAVDLTCLAHQANTPGARYTDEDLRRTDEVMPLLRYYTANGRKPFCDGTSPTESDRAWAELYIRLGADRQNVANILG